MPGWYGNREYYDENGKYIGESLPGLFGGNDHFNKDGHYKGYSNEGIFGGTDIYDEKGKRMGYALDGLLGGHDVYDNHGNEVAFVRKSILEHAFSIFTEEVEDDENQDPFEDIDGSDEYCSDEDRDCSGDFDFDPHDDSSFFDE